MVHLALLVAIGAGTFLEDSDIESWPSGSLSKVPFEWRSKGAGVLHPGLDLVVPFPDRLAQAAMSLHEVPYGDMDSKGGSQKSSGLGGPESPESVPLTPLIHPRGQEPEEEPSPHGSFQGFFQKHGSGDAWRDYVWDDYLTQPAILLPVGLAVSAAAISHWDRTLERHWHGLLGGRRG